MKSFDVKAIRVVPYVFSLHGAREYNVGYTNYISITYREFHVPGVQFLHIIRILQVVYHGSCQLVGGQMTSILQWFRSSHLYARGMIAKLLIYKQEQKKARCHLLKYFAMFYNIIMGFSFV